MLRHVRLLAGSHVERLRQLRRVYYGQAVHLLRESNGRRQRLEDGKGPLRRKRLGSQDHGQIP